MKRNRTLSILLSAAVLCACLWLAGCGQQGEETQQTNSPLDPRIAEYLSLDSVQASALADGIQNVDVTAEGNDATLHVIQTLGNQRELYILYDVTFADSVELPDSDEVQPGAGIFDFQSVEEARATTCSAKNGGIHQEGRTLTCMGYVNWENDSFPGGEMAFSVGEFFAGEQALTQETLKVSWTPTNQGTLLQKDVMSQDGRNVGTMTISPYSASFLLTEEIPARDANGVRVGPICRLLDEQGKDVRDNGGASGGGKDWSASFGKYVDLSKVATVELGEYTASLGE